jgi:hypothetical protein
LGKLLHDGNKLHTDSIRRKKNHFDSTRQFARHTPLAAGKNCEYLMKVFNRTVENRVEKQRSKSKSLARTRLCALCTIVVQFISEAQKVATEIALLHKTRATKSPK